MIARRRTGPLLSRALGLAGAVTALSGCRPDLGERESLVTETRVLAVRGEPPEAKPGEEVTYDVLVASPGGTIAGAAARWAFCAVQKPVADNASVSADCLRDDAVIAIPGGGPTVTAATPAEACTTFGPEVASAEDRPQDADVTGGYYQPVRVRFGERTAFGMERLSCDLADAPVDVVKEYLARYVVNANPHITELTASMGGAPVAMEAVPRGASVTFEVAWPAEDAQAYPVFDRAAQALVTHREALRVSWFVTGGELEEDRTGAAEGDPATRTANVWTAPDRGGAVFLWAVLRDSRGGVDFRGQEVEVMP